MANHIFMLHSDDHEAFTRCLQMAMLAHQDGDNVNLFFIDGAVVCGKKDYKYKDQQTITGDSPSKYLDYIINNNIPIGLCTPCSKQREISEDDIMTNSYFATGKQLISLVRDPESKLWNFGG